MKYQRGRQLFLYIAGTIAFLALPIVFAPADLRFSHLLQHPIVRKELFDYTLLALFFYGNYFFLIPKFYFTQKTGIYITVCVASLLVITVVPPLVFKIPFLERLNLSPLGFLLEHLRHIFFSFAAIVFFSLILRISNRWRQAEKEKLTSQLSNLKGQINPHFLFNTLNSIYYLSLEKSPKAPDAIIRLSNMMRFVISEANDPYVDLAKEISYVTNFIELQKLRLGNTVSLSYKITGTTVEKKIAPLVLIPFIENAFKHGINPEEFSCIAVVIEIEDNELTLSVDNKKVHKHYTHLKSGLGIANTKKRLELLYPNKHKLSIANEQRDYIVSLKLNLA
jgi:hypothetical protein